MASSTENVKLGVCTALFAGQDLGFTKGGVEVEVSTDTHEVTVDQLGGTPIDEIITGRKVTAKVPLAETTLENLVKIMPGATLVAEGGTKASQTVTFSTAAPVNNDIVTINGTAYTFKTVPVGPNDMAIPATFTAGAVALAAAVNASDDAGLYEASVAGAVVTVTAKNYGTDGNAITIAKTATNIAVGGATLAGGTTPTKLKVLVKTGVSTSLLSIAKKLVLRPKGTTGEFDFTILKAMTAGAIQFAYQTDVERVFNVTFKGYAAANGDLFSFGDNTAVAA